jgi:hypothetical protein
VTGITIFRSLDLMTRVSWPAFAAYVLLVSSTVFAPRSGRAELSFDEVSLDVAAKGHFAAIAMADIDGDGRAELLSGRRDGEYGLVLLEERSGKWSMREVTKEGEYGGVAFADLTGDGILDIVAVKAAGDSRGVEIHASKSSGGKLVLERLPSPYDEAGCDDLAVGDIESDGDVDLAVSTGGQGLKVLLNEGNGREFRTITLETKNYEDTGIGLGDVNGDGRLDVIAGNHPRKNPWLFLATSKGKVGYDSGHQGCLVAPSIGFEIVFGDFDGDSFQDVAMGTLEGLQLFRGNGCKGAESDWFKKVRVADPGHETMQVATGDIDRDGKPDLAFAAASGIHVVLNRGAAGFSKRVDGGLPQKVALSGCALFDQDGDGVLDIACSSLQGGGVRLFRSRGKP